MAENTALAKLQQTVDELDKIALDFVTNKTNSLSNFKNTLVHSMAIIQLQRLLNDETMKWVILPMKNIGLGFKTDEESRVKKGGAPYSLDVLRNCAIEATLRGLRCTGNEFNIIHGSFYATVNGCRRLVAEYSGLTDLEIIPEIPTMCPSHAIVGMTAKWKLNGQPMTLERTGKYAFMVKIQGDQGADAAIGKARRKMLAAIYDRISGSEQSLPEGDVDDIDFTSMKAAQGRVVSDAQEPATTASVSRSSVSASGSSSAAVTSSPVWAKPQRSVSASGSSSAAVTASTSSSYTTTSAPSTSASSSPSVATTKTKPAQKSTATTPPAPKPATKPAPVQQAPAPAPEPEPEPEPTPFDEPGSIEPEELTQEPAPADEPAPAPAQEQPKGVSRTSQMKDAVKARRAQAQAQAVEAPAEPAHAPAQAHMQSAIPASAAKSEAKPTPKAEPKAEPKPKVATPAPQASGGSEDAIKARSAAFKAVIQFACGDEAKARELLPSLARRYIAEKKGLSAFTADDWNVVERGVIAEIAKQAQKAEPAPAKQADPTDALDEDEKELNQAQEAPAEQAQAEPADQGADDTDAAQQFEAEAAKVEVDGLTTKTVALGSKVSERRIKDKNTGRETDLMYVFNDADAAQFLTRNVDYATIAAKALKNNKKIVLTYNEENLEQGRYVVAKIEATDEDAA